VVYRVYFNKRGDARSAWSVDDGDQAHETTHPAVTILAPCHTVYSGKPANDATPVAWLEVAGILRIAKDGRADIFPLGGEA
jgi:hypothetical protein